MRLTTRTNLAMRVLMYCAVNEGRLNRTADMAAACNASPNHLMQVVPVLHRNGFVRAIRGRAGGVSLAVPASEIVVGHVFRLFEASVPFTECFADEANSCPLVQHCRLKAALSKALSAFYGALDEITLGHLIEDNCGLEELLAHGAALRPDCAGPSAV